MGGEVGSPCFSPKIVSESTFVVPFSRGNIFIYIADLIFLDVGTSLVPVGFSSSLEFVVYLLPPSHRSTEGGLSEMTTKGKGSGRRRRATGRVRDKERGR